MKSLNITADVLKNLVGQGLIKIEVDTAADETAPGLMPPPSPPFELNPAQKKALRELGEALKSPGAETRLLYGVTGSGKQQSIWNWRGLCLKGAKARFAGPGSRPGPKKCCCATPKSRSCMCRSFL